MSAGTSIRYAARCAADSSRRRQLPYSGCGFVSICRTLRSRPAAHLKKPGVVEEQHGIHRVLLACPQAAAAGIQPGQSTNAALALLPTLQVAERSVLREQQAVEQLASWLEQFTSVVCIAGTMCCCWRSPAACVCTAACAAYGSSLRQGSSNRVSGITGDCADTACRDLDGEGGSSGLCS